jgi:hypothetical protein
MQRRIVAMWDQRLKDTRDDVCVWQQILSVRSLVLDPQQNADAWLSFASLCRKMGHEHLSIQVSSPLPKLLTHSFLPVVLSPSGTHKFVGLHAYQAHRWRAGPGPAAQG